MLGGIVAQIDAAVNKIPSNGPSGSILVMDGTGGFTTLPPSTTIGQALSVIASGQLGYQTVASSGGGASVAYDYNNAYGGL